MLTPDEDTEFPIPVTIVAGFLGSGKTTLLNHILSFDHGRRIAVIDNDLGSINIDADLVADVSEGMVSLANGCICCAIRSDLVKAVLDMCDTVPRPEHIVIESSGVADPNKVFRAFLQPDIRHRILLDGVLTVIDAEQILGLSGEERRLAEEQAAGGDLILLNKTDLVENSELTEIIEWMAHLNARAEVIETEYCRVPVEGLLGSRFHEEDPPSPASSNPEGHDQPTHHHEHNQVFESWSYESRAPLRLARLGLVLDHLPRQVFRAKRFIYTDDTPDKRHLLQMVGRQAVLSSDRFWGKATPQTRLVFIARKGVCNVPAIRGALGQCKVEVAKSG